MNGSRQVFQTESNWRWRSFKWTGRFIIATLLLMIPVVIITLSRGLAPSLPELSSGSNSVYHLAHLVTPGALSKRDLKKYKGFNNFLLAKRKNDSLRKNAPHINTQQVRAAFFVDLDSQAFSSLQKNIKTLRSRLS